MAVRTTTKKKTKTSRATEPKGSLARRYPCPNPGKPMGVAATVRRILSDPHFARFLRHQLRLAHKNDPDANKCVESYYAGPTRHELEDFGIDEDPKCFRCTEGHTHFIDGAAFYGKATKRKKKR